MRVRIVHKTSSNLFRAQTGLPADQMPREIVTLPVGEAYVFGHEDGSVPIRIKVPSVGSQSGSNRVPIGFQTPSRPPEIGAAEPSGTTREPLGNHFGNHFGNHSEKALEAARLFLGGMAINDAIWEAYGIKSHGGGRAWVKAMDEVQAAIRTLSGGSKT